MIRSRPSSSHLDRRQLLRAVFLGGVTLAGAEIVASVAPFMTVNKIVGLGLPVNVGPKAAILASFAETNDAPILFRAGHFFLLHPNGGIVAAYRKCTHLGCAVPWVAAEDRFHCPCHQSQYDKHTAVAVAVAILLRLGLQTAGFGSRPVAGDPSRNISLAVALLAIAIPVGAAHLWLIVRSFADPAERATGIRHQYLNLWVAFALLTVLFTAQSAFGAIAFDAFADVTIQVSIAATAALVGALAAW